MTVYDDERDDFVIDLRRVFEKHGYIWFNHEFENCADGLICKCYVVKEIDSSFLKSARRIMVEDEALIKRLGEQTEDEVGWVCPHFSSGDCGECEAIDCSDRKGDIKVKKC